MRSRIKAERPAAGITVVVHEGLYELDDTLRFGPDASGTETSPVVVRAGENEKVTLVGGRRISGFRPLRGAIVRADVALQGFRDRPIRELILDGRRQPLARYPNYEPSNPYGGGWAFADGKRIPMYQDVPGEPQDQLTYRAKDERKWSRPAEVEIFVFPRYNWWNNIVRIKSIDRTTRTITLVDNASYPIRPGDRYYARNAPEELDAPGEWYHDRAAGTLDFWPPTPLDGHTVVAPRLQTLVRFEPGTEYVTLRGFTLECAQGEAVVVRDSRHCTIAANTIRNVGDYHHTAVVVMGGRDNLVTGNDIHDVGSNGITLIGGDRVTLTPANHAAVNNYIHHVGQAYKQGVGIQMEGVGLRAEHNLIHDGPRMGIMFSGNNLTIAYNHIRHVNLETEDTGAVYTGGRDWISSRGTVIKHNYFHDMLGFGKDAKGRWIFPHFAWGVYLDDNAGGVDVIGNIVARCSRAGIHLHNGRDNRIEGNVFVANGERQVEYSGWTDEHSYWKNHFKTMLEGYERVKDQPAWRDMRGMKVDPRKAVLPDHTIMAGNTFVKNIVVATAPESDYVGVHRANAEHNLFDRNLVWHQGKPILTGVTAYGPSTGANLVANGDFEHGKLGALPDAWQWQIRPRPDATAGLVNDPSREHAKVLRIDAALLKEKPRDNAPIVVSREFAAKPGHAYRLEAWFRADRPGAKAQLLLQGYEAGAFFWANWPSEVKVGTEWAHAEFTFVVPGPGMKGYHSHMGQFRARVDFPDPSGSLFVDKVALHEVSRLSEWESWQKLGFDRHSVVADPKFVNPAHDDYRLQPDSPALALGFEPIPVEKIGPYRDPLRASWPIVEAEGAREHPVVVPVD
ncbi:MAG: right-handed parallel beta-helix repeat-containing protein [Isosphaeraceae bacterium]